MREFTVALEPWAVMWPEARALAERHWEEVNSGVEPRRGLKVDERRMALCYDAGCLKLLVARSSEAPWPMLGYFTWMLTPDLESEGLLIAQQGAFYVSPGHPRVALALARESILALRALGVQHIFPHHRLQGRGTGLGKFWKRQGAKLIQHTYSLWIAQGGPDGQH